MAVNVAPVEAPLLHTTWPIFTAELAAALRANGEDSLTDQVKKLRVTQPCSCKDDFCQSFYTAPGPVGAYGEGHRTICLDPPWPGYLNLDVVNDDIVNVEVLYRSPLC